MTRPFVLATALAFLVASVDAAAGAEPATSHVVVIARILCKAPLPSNPEIEVHLDDLIGEREYTPEASVEQMADGNVRFSFDVEGGEYGMFAGVKPLGRGASGDCSWNGGLLTLSGVTRNIVVDFRTMILNLWHPGDAVAGSIPRNATVVRMYLPRSQPCGRVLDDPIGSAGTVPQSDFYYSGVLASTIYVSAFAITYANRVTVLEVPAFVRSAPHRYAYMRRDITPADLRAWSALPTRTVICDPLDRYSAAS